ncbi:MAG: Octaprenyl diphosphate synthase [Firmicutes bacterium]|nr:Octaprenyl diphosphate synthase [Bacillota bacterium]
MIDSAEVRRGKATNGVYGNKNAVLWGDFCFANALRYVGKLGEAGVLEVGEAVARMVRGELRQLMSMGNLTLCTKECLEQSRGKTGALLSLAVKLGATVARVPYTIRALAGEFGERFGIVFQMRDDYLDYFGETSTLGKVAGKDMCEGVVTLPLLLAAQMNPKPDIMRLFAQRALAVEQLPVVQRWIAESGAEQIFLQMMREQGALAIAALRCLPQSTYRDALVNCVQEVSNFESHL